MEALVAQLLELLSQHTPLFLRRHIFVHAVLVRLDRLAAARPVLALLKDRACKLKDWIGCASLPVCVQLLPHGSHGQVSCLLSSHWAVWREFKQEVKLAQ